MSSSRGLQLEECNAQRSPANGEGYEVLSPDLGSPGLHSNLGYSLQAGSRLGMGRNRVRAAPPLLNGRCLSTTGGTAWEPADCVRCHPLVGPTMVVPPPGSPLRRGPDDAICGQAAASRKRRQVLRTFRRHLIVRGDDAPRGTSSHRECESPFRREESSPQASGYGPAHLH